MTDGINDDNVTPFFIMPMRITLTIVAFLSLSASVLLTVSIAHADDYYGSSSAPYPYFRRTDPAPVSSSVSSIADTPKVGLSVDSDRSEANPGDEVRYWIKARNLYRGDMPQWRVAFFFDQNQMQILETGGGRLEGDHVTFDVPSTRSNEERTFSVRVRLYRNLQPGENIRTYGSMIWDGRISPACSKNDLRIIAHVPVTGAGDGTSPIEDLGAFLRPVSSATSSGGSPMPLLVWGGVAILGLGVGGTFGKKFGVQK